MQPQCANMKICLSIEFSVKLILLSLQHSVIWTILGVLAISSKVQEEEKFEKNFTVASTFLLSKT